MRIWYQSSTALGADPLFEPYQKSLVEYIKRVARPDTRVEVHGVKYSDKLKARSRYVKYLNEAQVINNAVQAEREGYDAFCVGCTLDPGLPQIKEIVDIPVAFLFESCLHLACVLAGKFSLIAYNRDVLEYSIYEIRQYGLEDGFVACEAFNLNTTDLLKGFTDPTPIVDAVKQATRKAVEGGAGILLSTCNVLNMVLVNCGCREVNGVPILDTTGAIVKIAELMVDLKNIGVSRSKRGLYPAVSKEDLARIRKGYGIAD